MSDPIDMCGLCPRFCVFVHRFGQSTDPIRGRSCDIWLRFLKLLLRQGYHLLRYLSVVLCKVYFQEEALIGNNVHLSRKGNIIIGAEQVGDDCVIHHNVTLGMHLSGNKKLSGKPNIGDRVWIGPDTIIHGNIKVGDGVTILGGAVLTKNVPDRCVVGGNPAKILKTNFDNSKLLASCCCDVNSQTIQDWR